MIKCTFENGNNARLRHVTVDNLVLKDGKILLAKRADKLTAGGKWGLIGGYVERDENLQQAVQREVMEETGYAVSGIQLLTIRHNPDRPHEDRQSIAFVFFCEAGEKTGEADWESSERTWFDLNSTPSEEEMAFDHYKNIQLYKEYLERKFSLPIF